MTEQPAQEIDGVEDVEIEYEVVETVDVGEGDEPTELPEELDVDYDEIPAEETAGE